MRQISLTLNDNEFERFMDSLKSYKSAHILKSTKLDDELSHWQKEELDKSIEEIENNTIQSEDWSSIKSRLFKKYNVK